MGKYYMALTRMLYIRLCKRTVTKPMIIYLRGTRREKKALAGSGELYLSQWTKVRERFSKS